MKQIKVLYKSIILIAIILLSCLNSKADSNNPKIKSWHRFYTDSLQGTRSDDALVYLQKKKLNPQEIIVAIVDTGIDNLSTELK